MGRKMEGERACLGDLPEMDRSLARGLDRVYPGWMRPGEEGRRALAEIFVMSQYPASLITETDLYGDTFWHDVDERGVGVLGVFGMEVSVKRVVGALRILAEERVRVEDYMGIWGMVEKVIGVETRRYSSQQWCRVSYETLGRGELPDELGRGRLGVVMMLPEKVLQRRAVGDEGECVDNEAVTAYEVLDVVGQLRCWQNEMNDGRMDRAEAANLAPIWFVAPPVRWGWW